MLPAHVAKRTDMTVVENYNISFVVSDLCGSNAHVSYMTFAHTFRYGNAHIVANLVYKMDRILHHHEESSKQV